MTKIMSIDAETDGLYGPALAVAGIVYDGDTVVSQFCGRLPMAAFPAVGWVADKVTPACAGIAAEYPDRTALLGAFAEWYKVHKADAAIIAHMPCPVEAGLFIEMRRAGLISDQEGPYPLHDVAGYLGAAGHDPTSVDSYLAAARIDITARPECRRVTGYRAVYDRLSQGPTGGEMWVPHYPEPTVVHQTEAAALASARRLDSSDPRGRSPRTEEVTMPTAPHHPMYDAVAATAAYTLLRKGRRS